MGINLSVWVCRLKACVDTCKYKASDTTPVRAVEVAGAARISIATGWDERALIVKDVADTGVQTQAFGPVRPHGVGHAQVMPPVSREVIKAQLFRVFDAVVVAGGALLLVRRRGTA